MKVNITELLCYILSVVYLLYCVFQSVSILNKPKPTGPDAMGWALKIIMLFVAIFLLLINYLFITLQQYTTALIIFLFPFFPSTISIVQSVLLNTWANLKYTFLCKQPLLLEIENNSEHRLNIKLDCMRKSFSKRYAVVMESLSYFVDNKRTITISLSHVQSKLIRFNSHYVLFQIFKQEKINLDDRTIWKDIQPCFSTHQENSTSFNKKSYCIIINDLSAFYLVP